MQCILCIQALLDQNTVPEKEMSRCIDALANLQQSMKNANSAIVHAKMAWSKQITLHDCFKK